MDEAVAGKAPDAPSALTPFERHALGFARALNSNPLATRVLGRYARAFSVPLVHSLTFNLLHVEGFDHIDALPRSTGFLLCSNHRSFFDGYVLATPLLRRYPWLARTYFPVRSTFFYESVAGVAINLVFGALTMYPPVFRDVAKSAHNREAVSHIVDILARPDTMVGMHPEGTRGRGADPYTLLRAQPGVGEIALKAGVPVVPAFVLGLDNNLAKQARLNFRRGQKPRTPVIIVFGAPVDLSGFVGQTARPALYKRVADKILDDVRALGERERAIRAELARGG